LGYAELTVDNQRKPERDFFTEAVDLEVSLCLGDSDSTGPVLRQNGEELA